MRAPASLTPVLWAIFACTPDPGGATDSATTGSTTTSTTGSTGPAPTTTSPTTTGTTGPDSTTTAVDTTTTTAVDTTSTGDTTTTATTTDTTADTADTTTGEPHDVELAVFYVPGGLDRIVVRKADHDADVCTALVFVWPVPNTIPALTLPSEWALQDAGVHQGVAGCLEFQGPLPDPVVAMTAEGAASWPNPNVCPGPLDIDITLTFEPIAPWVPAQDQIQGTGLPLVGC